MPKENIKGGDLVLLADKNYTRGEWPIARHFLWRPLLAVMDLSVVYEPGLLPQ